MKIGIVTTWADCGAGHVSLAYAKALSASGFEVEIYSRGQYLRQQRWGVCASRPWPLHLDRSTAGLTRVDPTQFSHWLRTARPDWLVFNEQRSWAPVLQAKAAGVACAAYIDYYRADSLALFELYDLLFCHTLRHHSVFEQDQRACYIPWGVDTEFFRPGVRQSTIDHGLEPLVIVHSAGMGGPSDRKGTDLALQAFAAVAGQARLLLHTQLPRHRWPSTWIRAVQADPRIEVIEKPMDPLAFYQLGDLYLYPSRLEGIGLTLPEALSCGLAAITTHAPPMSEFVEDGLNGSLVPVQAFRGRSDGYYWPESWVDPDQLRVCIQRYVDQPSLARTQGKRARAAMAATRHWPALSSQMGSVMQTQSIRTLSVEQRRHLQRLAQHQDRLHEPTTTDHFLMGCRSLVRGWQREFLERFRR